MTSPSRDEDRVTPRLTPEIPFPPYAHVPGRTPHPISDPAGHAFGHEPPRPAPIDPANWRDSPTFLYALDLFNAGFYWEAHEAWESLWHAAGRHGPTADALKGLIKLSAAGVKAREDRPTGLAKHLRRAAELFRQARAAGDAPLWLGFRLEELAARADRLAADPEATLTTAAAPAERRLPITLTPGF